MEMGGAQELLNMLEGAKDDRTRKEALKALSALSRSGQTFSLQLGLYPVYAPDFLNLFYFKVCPVVHFKHSEIILCFFKYL